MKIEGRKKEKEKTNILYKVQSKITFELSLSINVHQVGRVAHSV